MVQQLSTNTFGTAKWIVSATASNGTHTTIAAALTSASSGDTIFIREGTYTENLTLKAGVNLCAYEPANNLGTTSPGKVIIVGKATFTAAGTVGMSGIVLQTNSDFALAVTGSAASIVVLENCFLNCTNNTGVSLTSSSASSLVNFMYCGGDITTTGITLFAHSGAGNIRFLHCSFTNTGASTTASTISGTGGFFPNFSSWASALSFSSSSTMNGSHLDMTMGTNLTAITTAGTSTVGLYHFKASSGTSSALSIGAGTSLDIEYGVVESSNASAIAGSGTLTYSNILFTSSIGIAGTLTQTGTNRMMKYARATSSLQPAFLATHTVDQNNVTGNGATPTINFTTEIFDQNSDYDGTNTFTAPFTGRYHFVCSVYFNQLDVLATQGVIRFITSNRTYQSQACSYGAIRDAGNQVVFSYSIIADMDAADTCTIQVQVGGMVGDTVDIPAGADFTFFGGYLEC